MVKILAFLLSLLALPALAQISGPSAVINGATPIIGGTTGNCVTQGSNGLASIVPCSSAAITSGTFASLPAAGSAGRIYYVTDVSIRGSLWMDNGNRWVPVNGCVLLASRDTISSGVTTPTLQFSYQMPANLLKVGDRLRVWISADRNQTTDASTTAMYVGTTGTNADAAVYSGSYLASTNLSGGLSTDYRLESATTMLRLANNGSAALNSGYTTATTSANVGAVTISSAVTNALYFSIYVGSSNTTTASLRDAQLYYCATPN